MTTGRVQRRWFGAEGWNMVACQVDLRVGGSWRFESRGPGGARMGHGGTYREVVAPERLVYTEAYDDRWFAGESLVTVALAEEAGLTTLTTTVRYPSREVRDVAIRSPMECGVGESFDRLARLLGSRHQQEAR